MRQCQRALAVLLAGITIASVSMSFPLDASARNRNKQSSVVTKLAGLFRKQPRRLGATRGSVCVVTPDLSGKPNLWSDHPLIVWHEGDVARVQVRLANSKTPVWDQSVPGIQTSVTYSGKPLQPGQIYEVVLLDNTGKQLVRDSAFLPDFVLLDVATRTHVSQALKATERQLIEEQGTVEEIVAAKAQYLLEHDLVSDAFQIIYAAQESSPELKAMAQEIALRTCPSSHSRN